MSTISRNEQETGVNYVAKIRLPAIRINLLAILCPNFDHAEDRFDLGHPDSYMASNG